MLIREYRDNFIAALDPTYDNMEAAQFFTLALEHFHKLRRIDLALNPNMTFSQIEIETYDSVLQKLKQQIPIQYILGQTVFCGLTFKVDNNVLIPRPETEELVAWIVSDTDNLNIRILDIGTGSGCIAISLANQLPMTHVTAWDVSEAALDIARENAKLNETSVDFQLVDVLKLNSIAGKLDVIVSNPPYVRNLEKHEIASNVLDHEPHLALFVEDQDALIFYRKIAQLAKTSLSENGKLYFEINQYLGKETVELLQQLGFSEIELRQDIYGNDRMIRCTYS